MSRLAKCLLTGALCVTMMFSLVACGETGNTGTSSEVESSEKESSEKENTESTVTGVEEGTLNVALNVMFNDAELACYNVNEVGPSIAITGNGQYTVTFDFAKDCREETKTTYGVKGLNNLTAIYIKDYDVTVGNLDQSNLVSCNIRWDKVVVDGVELTITKGDFKSGIKASGIFDTNDPLNAWDGSAVEEVTIDSSVHSLVINGIENPQTISVTFTIEDLLFAK